MCAPGKLYRCTHYWAHGCATRSVRVYATSPASHETEMDMGFLPMCWRRCRHFSVFSRDQLTLLDSFVISHPDSSSPEASTLSGSVCRIRRRRKKLSCGKL